MNRVFLSGFLAADPKQNFTSKGHEQSLFSVGVNDAKNYNESYFIPCVAWNKVAKFINEHLKKGSLVVIDGRLVRRSYTDSNNKNVYVMEIQVDSIKSFLTKKSDVKSNDESTNNVVSIAKYDEVIAIDDVINDQKSDVKSNNTPVDTYDLIDEILNDSNK